MFRPTGDPTRTLRLLDSMPRERFERVARIARRALDAPMAKLVLVDGAQQRVQASHGIEPHELPQVDALCDATPADGATLVVDDPHADPRFAAPTSPQRAQAPAAGACAGIRFFAGCALRAPDGAKVGTLGVMDRVPRRLDAEAARVLSDLAAIVEQEVAALELATLDELTGIANRRGFMMLASHSLTLCARRGLPASVVYADLDRLKTVNDLRGHAVGDRMLAAFAAALRDACRHSDVCARIGGDEFVALLPDARAGDACSMVERLRTLLGAHGARVGVEIAFSHGIVEHDPRRHAQVEALLAEADALMYRGKERRG